MTALIALMVLCQSPNTDAEIFVDRGETYIRAGLMNGLEVGAALEVFDAKSRQPIGSATVMEVWESLSRVNLDSKSAAHAPLKVARVMKRPEPVAQAPQGQAYPEPQAAPPAAAPLPMKPIPQTGPGPFLDGEVTMIGAGQGRRIIVKNKSNRDWHNCDVRLPNGKHYWIGDLDAGDDDGVMLFRFDFDRTGPIPQPAEGVGIVCREGSGRYPISL